ncbi:hypothetical protein BKA70DRAFT_1227531 [Coprinopsis sp. MPI-PUGE-AT-0042]|nr:hypothetical protein BKA70DRAFT_1227531 [Coprinopsis sp. MPI-PUGE-AT-0042]
MLGWDGGEDGGVELLEQLNALHRDNGTSLLSNTQYVSVLVLGHISLDALCQFSETRLGADEGKRFGTIGSTSPSAGLAEFKQFPMSVYVNARPLQLGTDYEICGERLLSQAQGSSQFVLGCRTACFDEATWPEEVRIWPHSASIPVGQIIQTGMRRLKIDWRAYACLLASVCTRADSEMAWANTTPTPSYNSPDGLTWVVTVQRWITVMRFRALLRNI